MKRRRKGFLLIEILLATTMFICVLMAYAAGLTTTLGMMSKSRDNMAADFVNLSQAEDDLLHIESDPSSDLSYGTVSSAPSSVLFQAGNGDTTGDMSVSFAVRSYVPSNKKSAIYILLQRL